MELLRLWCLKWGSLLHFFLSVLQFYHFFNCKTITFYLFKKYIYKTSRLDLKISSIMRLLYPVFLIYSFIYFPNNPFLWFNSFPLSWNFIHILSKYIKSRFPQLFFSLTSINLFYFFLLAIPSLFYSEESVFILFHSHRNLSITLIFSFNKTSSLLIPFLFLKILSFSAMSYNTAFKDIINLVFHNLDLFNPN